MRLPKKPSFPPALLHPSRFKVPTALRLAFALYNPALRMQRHNTHRLHPRNSNLALPQFVGHGWRMVNFRKELRAIRGKLQEAGWSTQDWASDADIAHSTLWRILDRAQTPSLPTYLALLKSADRMIGEKKIASAQK